VALLSVRYDRITTDPERMAGQPCIRDLRFPVATVAAMVADGMTFEQVLACQRRSKTDPLPPVEN